MPRTSALSCFGAFGALGAVALLFGAGACGDSSAPAGPRSTSGSGSAPSSSAAPGDDILATVNGVPIRMAELQFVLARKDRSAGKGVEADRAKAALDELVELEAARQAAVGAGLDADAEYVKKLRFLEAPFVQFQREELSGLYLRRELAAKGQADDAELRKYFDAHAADLKSQLQLMQILVRNDEAKIRDMKKKIDAGASFGEVAATLFPAKLPEGSKTPWDLGVMRYTQVPEQWREALGKMKDGDVSDVIAGPKGRFWIVKLVKRQVSDAVTFEQMKPELVDLVYAERVAGLAQKTKAELRKKADVVYVREPGAIPPPPEPED